MASPQASRLDATPSPRLTEFFLPAFQWMEVNLPGGPYLRESTFGFSILLTAHVVAMCVFFGLILMMDLRLVGVANLRTRASEISPRLLPWQMFGFILMAVTGVALFWAQPLRYFGKTFFWWKMGHDGAGRNQCRHHSPHHAQVRGGVGQQGRQDRRGGVDCVVDRHPGAGPPPWPTTG